MLKTPRIIAIIAALAALPAVAGADGFTPVPGDTGTVLEQYRYFVSEEGRIGKRAPATFAAPRVASSSAVTAKANGFEYIGGEPGWQLIPHKLVWASGRFAHSDECDHAVRIVKAPSPADMDAVKRAYPAS